MKTLMSKAHFWGGKTLLNFRVLASNVLHSPGLIKKEQWHLVFLSQELRDLVQYITLETI